MTPSFPFALWKNRRCDEMLFSSRSSSIGCSRSQVDLPSLITPACRQRMISMCTPTWPYVCQGMLHEFLAER